MLVTGVVGGIVVAVVAATLPPVRRRVSWLLVRTTGTVVRTQRPHTQPLRTQRPGTQRPGTQRPEQSASRRWNL